MSCFFCCNHATSTLVDVQYVLFNNFFCLEWVKLSLCDLFFGQSNVFTELGVGLVLVCPLILVAYDFLMF